MKKIGEAERSEVEHKAMQSNSTKNTEEKDKKNEEKSYPNIYVDMASSKKYKDC